MLTWTVPADSPLAWIIALAVLGAWVLVGINLAFSFRDFETACKKHNLNDVEVFFKPYKKYPDEVKRLAWRSWFSLAFWVLSTKLLMGGGVYGR